MVGRLIDMRRWLVLIAAAGCGFELRPTASTDAPAADAPDAMPDAPLPACMTNTEYTAGGPQLDHRYRVVSTPSMYDTALEQCAADGAHLAAIESAEENAFLATRLDGSDAWLGYDDLDLEGAFRWVSGASDGFKAFAAGEPNDNPTEDCTVYRADTMWNDSGCEQLHRAVCECDPGYVAPPVAACRAVAGPTTIQGRSYFIRVLPRSWPDADADCMAIGAYLAVPGDDDENQRLNTSHPADSWIGYSDRLVRGMFAWVNGAAVGYTKWAATQPNGLPGENCVAIAFAGGYWDDADCGILRRYTCECAPLTR